MSQVNYITNIDKFLMLWNLSASPPLHLSNTTSPTSTSPHSAGAFIYQYHHPNFIVSLEAGVRDLVLALINHFDCVTYSSCEGHPSTPSKLMLPVHVGILSRTQAEHNFLQDSLSRLTHQINYSKAYTAAYAMVISGQLDSESGSRPCLDLILKLSGSELKYFAEIPIMIREAISLISKIKTFHGKYSWNRSAQYYFGITTFVDPSGIIKFQDKFKKATPYPHLWIHQLITKSDANAILNTLSNAEWNRICKKTYEFDVVDILNSSFYQRYPFNSLVPALASQPFCETISQITGCKSLKLDSIHAHRMTKGQYIGVHTDGKGHSSAVRLIIYLSRRRLGIGGTHLLLRERKKDFVIVKKIAPQTGNALLFSIGDNSFHAVTLLLNNIHRYTLVITYNH